MIVRVGLHCIRTSDIFNLMVESSDNALDRAFVALSHPVRRGMLAQLQRAERHQKRVTELAEPFDISLNAVSKHIRILEGARLVTRRVEGRDHWIAANPGPLLAATSWMEKQAKFWSPRLQALAKLVEKQ